MDYAFRRVLATRGAVYKIYNVTFPDRTKSKYCVLMENCSPRKNTAIIIFTTSRTEFKSRKTSVFVQDGKIKGINGDTLIQCDNYKEIESSILFDITKSEYLCKLDELIMQSVDEALSYVRNIDEATLIRMAG